MVREVLRVDGTGTALLVLTGLFTLAGCGAGDGADPASRGDERVAEVLSDPASRLRSAARDAEVPDDPQAIALNNRGVGLMGYFDYAGARETFAELVERHPQWRDARINLAIATLNRQGDGDEARAGAILDAVLAESPDDLRAHFVAGLLRLYQGEQAAALEHFGRVAKADPDDAYAAYYTGQLLASQGRADEAMPWFERAIAADPYLRSAYYGASIALRQLGRRDDALAMQARYSRLENNPRARLAEFKYTRMGPRANALAVGTAPPRARGEGPAPAGPVFAAPAALAGAPRAAAGASLTTADIDGDGRQDVFLTATAPDGGAAPAGSAVLLEREGALVVAPAHPLTGRSGVVAAAWADFDNDGLLDVYLCRRGDDELWMQRREGTDATPRFEERSSMLGAARPAGVCRDVAAVDADHDGDVDVFVVAEDANHLLNNDLDGAFREIAADQGIAGPGHGRQVLFSDLDGDRDADIVVLHDTPPHVVYLNDRLWDYRVAPASDAFTARAARAAVSGDVDADGEVELYVLQGAVNDGDGDGAAAATIAVFAFAPQGLEERARHPAPAGARELALADVDGSGRLQLLVTTADAVRVLELPDPPSPAGAAGETGDDAAAPRAGAALVQSASVTPAAGRGLDAALAMTRDAARGPGLLLAPAGGDLEWVAPGAGRRLFAAFTFSGRESAADSMRSNAAGIGTRIALRRGERWSVAETFDASSARGQSLQPLALGLGGAGAADFLAVDWSDGVFQTELDLAAGERHHVTETQRQLASCPVLFAWDGHRHAFVTDLLGVGGIGFFLAPGQYSEPRPWERLLLGDESLAPRDGRYVLKLTEPMEEIAYVDHMRLEEVRVPPGWSVALDERHATDPGRPPSGELLWFRDATAPVLAVDGRGDDVTAAVAAADGRAVPVRDRDRRFLGRLTAPAVLTLDFGAPLDARRGRPVLLADGWVEYPYSQTVFAAWQAGAAYTPPTLAVSADGRRFTEFAVQFGYPAGMPRQMALPLDGLPPGTRYLRLASNLELYWDRLRVVYAQAPPAEASVRALTPVVARLARTGFPRRDTLAQRRPAFDYAERQPFWDTRYMRGAYTAFGDVMPLLAAADDALALVGPGEELHVEFEADAAALAVGWQRRFVLTTEGWAKDMDLYTRDGDTVEPMPHRSTDPAVLERRDALHARFHTRPLSGK